jgi:multidrug transporter EmrE-like cation transporter
MAGVGILATRVFEWDFFYDSLTVAASGGVLTIAGIVIEKVLKRGRTA